MEVHFSAEMFKQKPKQYHLPLESQAFLFSHITGFPCYGLLNARSRNTNHPIGNLAILLIHISYSLQLYSLHHLPRKSWDKCHHLLWSFVFYHSKNTKSPPERNRATTKIRITSAELRSDDSKFFFGTNDGFEKITCQWRIAAGDNVGTMVTHRSGWCRHWKATKLFYKLYVIHVLYHIRISNERNRILWIVIYIQSSHVSEVKHQMNSNDRINDHSISWYSVWLSLTSDCFFIQFMYQTQSVSLGFPSRKSGSFHRKCRQNKSKKAFFKSINTSD